MLLIEAGGSDRDVRIRAPGLYFALWRSKHDWNFSTEPQAGVDGRRMYWPRGKVLGGCSSLNASLYVRGHRDDYDGWRDAGNPGWGWDEVLPYFRRSQDQQRGASAHHGGGGPLRVEDQRMCAPVSVAFAEALARGAGVAKVDDFNRGDSEGAGLYQVTCRDGLRCSTAQAFLAPARKRPNLTVASGALALGLTFAGSRVDGVRYRIGTKELTATARREVLLCGGSIGSPQLLMLSGIGPAAHLKEHGIPVRLDRSGVGQNLQDHLMATVTYDVAGKGARRVSRLNLTGWMARYLAGRGGPFGNSPVEAGGFVKSVVDAPRPDLQFMFAPVPTDEPNTDEARGVPYGHRRMTMLPSLLYPRSRGELRLRSSDPAAAPAIEPRYFSAPEDLELLVRGVKLSREVAATGPLAPHIGAEVRPGPAATDDDAIRASIRRHVHTSVHPGGTCAMGTGADAVVDPSLRVHGIDGLRVIDGSIMPTIVGGNTNAPIIMIAERAADLIRAS